MIHSDQAILPYAQSFAVPAYTGIHTAPLIGSLVNPALPGGVTPAWVGDFTTIQLYLNTKAAAVELFVQWFDTNTSGQLLPFGQQTIHVGPGKLLLLNQPTRLPWCYLGIQGAAATTVVAEVRLNNLTHQPLTDHNFGGGSPAPGLFPVATAGVAVPANSSVDVETIATYIGKAHLWASGPAGCSVQLRAQDFLGTDLGIFAQTFIIGTPAPDSNFEVGLPPFRVIARFSNTNASAQTVFAGLVPT